jgi:hypothetical protein
MPDNVPIASYTDLLQRRLDAVQALTSSLRGSQDALLERDAQQSSAFTEQQSELCNEIEFLNRDLRSADEILEWAKALKPDNNAISQIRRFTEAAEAELLQSCMVHSSLVRRAKRSVTIMMSVRSKDGYNPPFSYEALREEEA